MMPGFSAELQGIYCRAACTLGNPRETKRRASGRPTGGLVVDKGLAQNQSDKCEHNLYSRSELRQAGGLARHSEYPRHFGDIKN